MIEARREMAPQAKHRQSCPGAIISHPERLRLSTASRALGHLQLSLPSPLLASFVAGVAVASLPSATKNWQWKGKRSQHCLDQLVIELQQLRALLRLQARRRSEVLACMLHVVSQVSHASRSESMSPGQRVASLKVLLFEFGSECRLQRGCSPRWASRRRRVRMGRARPRGQKQQPLHHLLLQVSSLSRK